MNKDIAEFFDKLAPEWSNNPQEYNIREKLIAMTGLLPNSVIADIGCGKGVMFDHLLKTNPAKIIAVDISAEMLREAKKLYSDERIEYINDDFSDAELPILDAAVIFNAYPHFLDKQALIKKLSQTVKKNGMVVIAHSKGKDIINGVHEGKRVSKLSVPLEDAESEADKFKMFFSPDIIIDNNEIYFIKMLRR